jgi:hypothetical protein
MTFLAVDAVLDAMVEKLLERWEPYLRGFEGNARLLATIARGLQRDAATQCYRDGIERGVRNERERLGLPVDGDDPEGPTRPVICPHCGR